MEGTMKVVKLGAFVKILVPALFVSSIPASTRGLSFEGGKIGFSMGALELAGSLIIAWMLLPFAGVWGLAAALWLFGSAGMAMMLNGVEPIAFVKPICVECRLLPIIKEHEAIHLSGVESDQMVWAEMRKRYSCESLELEGDPKICSFCPIPKRLREP